MAITEDAITEDTLNDPTLLDTYNAQPQVGISYEVTPEERAKLKSVREQQAVHQAWLDTPVEPTDYSALSGKQNRAIKNSLDFVVGDNRDLYSEPATTKEDYFKRGFLDQNGKATEIGLLAASLVKKGVLNKDFTLTEEGGFFNMKESEFFTQGNLDQGSEINLSWSNVPQKGTPEHDLMLKWQRAKDLGLHDEDEVDKPFVDTVIETGKGFGEFLYNSLNTIRSAGALVFDSPLQDVGLNKDQKEELEQKRLEDKTRVYGTAEGFVENAGHSLLKQTAFVNQGTNKLASELGIITPEQEKENNSHNYYKAASIKNFQNKTDTVAGITEAVGVNAMADLLIDSAEGLGAERSMEIIQEGEQPGAMLGDLATWELGPLMKIGGAGFGAGGRLLNATINAKRINQGIQVTTNSAKAGLYAANAEQATLTAQLWTREIQTASLLEREAIAAGNTAEAVSHAANKARYVESARLAAEQAAKNAAKSQGFREAANVLENSLPPAFQSQLAKAAMVSGAVPLKVAGFTAKKLGSALATVDRGTSAILKTFGMDKVRGLARAAGVFTGYINPYTIAEGIVASHKLWTGAGRLLNSLGENMLVNQGTAPFFRRVAADMATPVGRTFATVADTFIPPIARGVGAIAKGVQTAAAPSLIFRAINEQGLDANVFKHAAADALVFGAPLGFGAAIIGKHSDFKSARQADRADFNNRMKADPAQYEIYNSMVDPSMKNEISSFSASYPNIQIKFVTEGPSFQQGNTAVINVNAPREFVSIVALHELKHTLANEFQLNELIKQKMVGDRTRPGDIFTKDGVLDPEFIAFGKEYNRRMKAGGMEELGIEDMAIEFYTDKAAEVLKSDITSGEFTRRAKESQLSRSMKSHFSTLVNQVPIIKNIHLKTGGAIDNSGKLVMGSGLVSGGLTQSPVVQAMVRKMYRETAGLTRRTKTPDGATISNTRIPQTKSTREGINNGTTAVENVNKQSREAGLEIPAGALDPSTPRGRDGVPTPLQTKAIVDSGAIHPDHLATFPTLVAEMVPESSATFMFEYRPARQGRTVQSESGETFHHVKPAGVRTNKKGNVLIIGLDINLWDRNIKKVANSKAAKDLKYSEKDIRADSYEASKFHINNKSPDVYFEGKYGKEQGMKRKSLVAATYGEMTKSQHNYNPLLIEAGMGKADGVYRTFSLDDIKSVSRTNSTADLAFDPNNYYSLKVNLMPEAPIVDRSGNIIENPVMQDFFDNHLPSGQRFRENSTATPAAYDSIMARYKGMPSTEVSAKGRVYSPIVRDLLQRRKAGEIIPKSVMDRAITEHFPSYKVKVPKSPSDLPSQSKVLASILPNKQEAHFETMKKGLPLEGEKVTVRQDVPAMTDFGVGVVTTTTKNGKIYRPSTRIKDPVFVLNEIQTEKIGMGEGKAPHIVVNGKWSKDQSFPKDLDTWTQVGFNPDRHSYYYERGTNKMVVSGKEALQIGNTVFVKKPDFGNPMDANAPKRYMPEASGAKFKPSKVTARDINEIAKEVGGGEVSGGAKKFGAFMRSMNEKKGGITLRDVVKSYAITQSSIQRGALKNASLRKSWADHPFKEEFIRPEDAFAKLLQTKEGKAYLDSAEAGIFNKEAATVMIDKFRSFGLHNTLAKHLEQAVNQFHPKAKELLSAIRDMPTSEFIDYIQKNYKGISYGKTGFFSGNLGRGDIPTFDSRQSKLVYGEVVNNTKKVIMDQTDRLPQLGIKVPNEFKDFTQTLLHHEIWDRLNKTNTEHLDIKETMLRHMPEKVTERWNPDPIRATNKVAKEKGIPNRITEDIFDFLEGKPISVGMADLLGAGGKVRGVSVTGGPGYPVQMFDPKNPLNITAVWASKEQGVRGILQNLVKTNAIWQDKTGHNWAIYSPHTMLQSAHKSNAQTPLIYVSKVNKMASRGALTKETAVKISNHIRKNVSSAKDMPDIGSLKMEKFIEDAAFETRAAIMKELTTTRSKEIGAPSPESVLTESRDVQYQGVAKNSLTSLLLIDIDRMAKRNTKGEWELRKDLSASDFGVESHPSYDTVMPGRILAHFDNPVPFEIAVPEMVSSMYKASPKSRPDRLLVTMPPNRNIIFQPLTRKIMEDINTAQDISGNVPYIREVVKAGTGNWKRFSGKDSQKGLKEFTFAIERSPAKESLTQYDYADVKKMIKKGELEVHQLGENDIWFGVKKTQAGNDLVSVVNNTGIPGMLNVIMARAIEAGVNTLDASSVITSKTPNGLLPTLYKRYGWKETGRDKFDRKYLVERNKSDTKAQHEAKIAQKEAALKMFWEEQGWDGKTMPDIVYMKLEGKTNGKQTGPVINEYGEGLAARKIGSTGSTSKATTSEVRGSGRSRGQGQDVVGGTPTGSTGANSGVLPRGFDSVIETIRSASDIQLKSMGLTLAEKKKFLDRFDK